MRKVTVKFLDTVTCDTWMKTTEIVERLKSLPCIATGWVIFEDDTQIKLAALMDDEFEVTGMAIAIPKGGVVSIEDF